MIGTGIAVAVQQYEFEGLKSSTPITQPQSIKSPIIVEKLPAQPLPKQRLCKNYTDEEKDYSYCRFEDVDFYGSYNPENAYFKGAAGIPAWIQKGLDGNGIYSQRTLIAAIRNGHIKELQDANLQKADLRYADMQQADLRAANLQDARLEYANVQGAQWSGANLTGAEWINGKRCGPGSIGACR